MKKILLLKQSLYFLFLCYVFVSCYSTRWYSYSLESEYNQSYRGKTKMEIINRVGTPTRIAKVDQNVEVLIYENFSTTSIGLGNATAYGGYNSVNAYGNNYTFNNTRRNYVEFYIGSGGTCYQVKTNALGWEKRREKVSFWEW